MRIILNLVLFVFASFAAYAGDKVSVRGRVIDASDGHPIEYAQAYAMGPDRKILASGNVTQLICGTSLLDISVSLPSYIVKEPTFRLHL